VQSEAKRREEFRILEKKNHSQGLYLQNDLCTLDSSAKLQKTMSNAINSIDLVIYGQVQYAKCCIACQVAFKMKIDNVRLTPLQRMQSFKGPRTERWEKLARSDFLGAWSML